MIRYLKRFEIDENKYNSCIELALNSRIYAYCWYLDIVADNWDVLVLNDYEAVMPLPWRSKYFIKYIYPPAWTQQLGVFSKSSISQNLLKEFIAAIPKKFKKVTIQFNSGNNVSFLNTAKRVNYILSLDKDYEEIYKGFNKNRKRNINKAVLKNYKIDKQISSSEFLNFYLNEPKNYQLRQDQITTIKDLLKTNTKAVFIWGIREDEKLIASLIWLKDNNRITYLLPVASKEAKDNGLPTLIISELIKHFSVSNFVFDFEGSMIEGLADFYISFGAKREVYFNFLSYSFY
ncbi:hypothetical protein [uncultured Lutibacter sp.]|uniref:hypothetical protein n=1 Tax=uncultured Lutibacter sp. TaxID=437739 RepID=UPI0026320B76|nr:hypothetical protein [uncultured Lutibacter sp.]